jgi:hypothetical protein
VHSVFVLVSKSVSCVSVFTYILEVTRKFDEGEEVGERGIKIKGKGGIQGVIKKLSRLGE